MTPDPVLEGLIAAGVFAIAADRYEEETGDTELAALMRIPDLEWELVGGKPGLKVVVEEEFFECYGAWYSLWQLRCGTETFGEPMLDIDLRAAETSAPKLLDKAGLGQDLAPRMCVLFREAIQRKWSGQQLTSGLPASPCPATP